MLFNKPLDQLIRPKSINEFIGHENIVKNLTPQNLILWGPPGVGKTTLALILSKEWEKPFIELSAVLSGKKEIKEILKNISIRDKQHIIFIDEIHAFNKTQQNIFLKHVEEGKIILIGATTENPSFEVISPLISRCKILKLEKLNQENLKKILNRAINYCRENGLEIEFYKEFPDDITLYADGDARILINAFENVVEYLIENKKVYISKEKFFELIEKNYYLYDKNYEEHYNLISAFHKSLRGSDPDAALYWCFRMLEAGEDPRYILRRLIVCASEDIGNADPDALNVAINAMKAYEFVGPPEGYLAIAQATIYLATAPKSNSVYRAMKQVKKEIKESGSLPVPLHLRNAVTNLMKKLGYGKDYKYPHDFDFHFVNQEYFPEGVKNKKYYQPGDFGFEKEIKKRLEWWDKLKRKNID